LAKARGAKRAILLPVSAPFHCALMQPAADSDGAGFGRCDDPCPRVPLVANVRAQAVENADDIRALLIEQVTGAVRWRESIIWMAGAGVTEFWEIGAGKALSGMIKRITKDAVTRNFATPGDIAALHG
jgi:[acyl-carrier-protein] S-malonyltransferase